MALDTLIIAGLAAELDRRLAGARVDKVTMPRRDRIVLHLRAAEGNVRLLLCAGNAARVHLTQEKFDNPETPPMLCMLLRKQMAGGRILSVTQPEHERLLELRFTALDELGVAAEKRLICEMMGRMTNLILVGPEDIIIARPGSGVMDGVVSSNVFIGVHYEMCIEAGGFEWLAQNTVSYPVGTQVSIDVLPENIQIMHKPVSAAQEVIKKNE